MPRPFELFLSGLTLAFAGVTCSTDAQTPCEVLTERACGDSDKPGRQVCTADGRWSEECETVERECDTSECTSNGLCRTAELVSPARSASTWAVALGSKSVGLLTERVGGGPSSLSFEVLDGFGLANQPRVELKSTNESIAIAHLVASEGLFAANWETWAGRQRADVGVDVFSDSGQPQGRVRYANERRAGRLYPSSDGFTHVYFEGELQAQEISQQGEELGEPMVFQSPNFSVGNLALASNGQTQLLVASAHSTEPKLTAVLWDDSGRKIGDFTSLAQGYVEQLAADWNGSVFGVAWLLNDALWLAEISEDGEVQTNRQIASGDLDGVTLKRGPGGWLVMSTLSEDSTQRAFVMRVDTSEPERWSPLFLSPSDASAKYVGLDADGDRVIAGWRIEGGDAHGLVQLQNLEVCD